MSETVSFKNPTDTTISLASLGLGDVEPGATVDVRIELCAAGRKDNGQRKASPIEQCAPQLVPTDEVFLREWRKVPLPPEPKSRITSLAPQASSEPPGVAAARAAKAAAENAQAAQGAKKGR